jgi:DNA-directed RNA polymerase subunit alpha
MEETAKDGIETMASKDAWIAEDARELMQLASGMAGGPDRLRAALRDMERQEPEPKGALALKIGICRYVLCRFGEALQALAEATDNKDRHYLQAICLKYMGHYGRAAEELERAGDRGWDATEIQLQLVEVQALSGDREGARKALGRMANKLGSTAEFLYLQGLTDELDGFGERAAEAYEKARSADPTHAGATFRLAFHLDLRGDEDRAVELYKECAARPPVHVNALMNLAVLYEDAGDYDAATTCLRRVLANQPNHQRARLFLKDVEASKTMYFDEDQARRLAKRNAVLDIPVTDFELSVRARNCLKKMNIRTLGDLVMTTEAELLAYKNFGETSLREIKEMLTAKGLRLGQGLEEADASFPLISSAPTRAENEGLLATPLERVEFSVRARKAIDGLDLDSLGDLARKSEAELLACRNFGQSSLNEVRQRLAEYGLHLREPE